MAVSSTAAPSGAATAAEKRRNGADPKYQLSQFRVVGDLGAGSFGTVHKVVNEETAEVFAMKVLVRERVVQRDLQEQLKREVLTQLQVKHTNVVRLHYYFEDEAKIYCLLEYADAGQLFAYLRRQPKGVPEAEAARLFGDTANGLAYLHSLRIVHRDLKPENILLFGKALRAKIGDFGWCAELTAAQAQRSTFCGTLEYLAPEMILNNPHDTTLDLWALGVLLYEMLMAKAPFTGDSQKDTMDRICAVRFTVPAGSMTSGPEELIRGLLVMQGSRRMALSRILQHPWLAAAQAPQGPSDDILDVTRAAPGRGAGLGQQGSVDMLEQTRIAHRPRTAPPPGGREGGAGREGPLDPAGLDRTVTVPRRQAGPRLLGSGASSQPLGDWDSGLEQTRVVVRKPPSQQSQANIEDTDPMMPSLHPVQRGLSGSSLRPAQKPLAPVSPRRQASETIRTEYAASCNPRPKERSRRSIRIMEV